MTAVASYAQACYGAQREGERLTVTVSGCLFTCCGKGWSERHYEATYTGFVLDVFRGGVRVSNPGLGTITYQIIVTWAELVELRVD